MALWTLRQYIIRTIPSPRIHFGGRVSCVLDLEAGRANKSFNYTSNLMLNRSVIRGGPHARGLGSSERNGAWARYYRDSGLGVIWVVSGLLGADDGVSWLLRRQMAART